MADSPITKQQHYLPNKALLTYFTDGKGQLNVYRFTKGVEDFHSTGKHFTPTPANMAKEGYIYETPELPTNTLEKVLATIENAHIDVMEKKIKRSEALSEEDESVVRLFVEMLQGRVPTYRDHLNEFVDQIEETGRQLYMAHNTPVSEDWVNEMSEVRERFFAMNIMSRLDIHPMQYTDLCILRIDESTKRSMHFYLPDNPVSMMDYAGGNTPYGLHPANKCIEIIVPISKDHAVFMNNCGITGYKDIGYFEVDEINLRSMRRSKQFLITSRPVDDDYYNRAINRHHPISFVLKFLHLPRGRMAKQLEKIKKQEKKNRKN